MAADWGREALWTALQVCLPVMVAGLAAGLLVAFLQAATQIQEPTASHLPRLVAAGAVLFLLLPWMLSVLSEYGRRMLAGLATWVP